MGGAAGDFGRDEMGERFHRVVEGEGEDPPRLRVPWLIDKDEFVVLGKERGDLREFYATGGETMDEDNGGMV